MIINATFDPSMAQAPDSLKAVIDYVVGLYEATFSNNVTLNIAFGWGEVGGKPLPDAHLGESASPFTPDQSFSQIQAAAKTLAQAGDPIPLAGLPATTPLSGTGIGLTAANAKALGLLPANGTAIDGYIGIKANPNVFNFDLSVATPGDLQDAAGVVGHEIAEVMGRTSGLDGDDSDSPLLLDLYRYLGPNNETLNAGGQSYLSIDHGATSVVAFNPNPRGDVGDWALSNGPDSYQAFFNFGPAPLSSADLLAMAALGWISAPTAQVVAEFAAVASGGLSAGKTTTIGLDFNTAVFGAGTPSLTLQNGDTAAYAGGLGGHVLLFSYTPSHAVADVAALAPTALNLNGGSLANAIAAPASLSLADLGPESFNAVTASANDIVLSRPDSTVFLITGGGPAIAGGAGLNIAAFTGSLEQYIVTASGGVITVADGLPGRDGTTTLTNVQQAQFSDYTLVFDLHSSQDLLVYELYQSTYNRTPDNSGFRYWASMADVTGASALSIADQFMSSAEFNQIYGARASATDYVTALYQHTLGRAPDAAGLDYWMAKANHGEARDQLLVDFATSAENVQTIGSHISNGFWTTH